ncbi:hypothetical protein O4160_08470 [Rhodococcus sp. IEGM 1401]|uniref:hypothetical protein n=1 Tax=unclassified Rhodococcus (in: high G+C Gram-positive bacteria) TaxID=192944 RepID=UPI0022B4B940|nr:MULTISPECIES: hypothetical protein [unclassified Rhodococcus (in: high G+C Gram-positive bacteria)]MCZ4560875.1 hypothetical protein [Rhodococcus sp. IEGM 1401]MDI9921016.1 hypothetical protein [Rhodococcus sp. IEGM 1372]MDV8033384.1 hypothetical protein [Rhodococcus sp. IEGM 1414]
MHERSTLATRAELSVAKAITSGTPYAMVFAGQGSRWLDVLDNITSDFGLSAELRAVSADAARILEPVAARLAGLRPRPFEPMDWVDARASDDAAGVPSIDQLVAPVFSGPGILLTQIAVLRALRLQGIDVDAHPPVSIVGHSQGCWGVAVARTDGGRVQRRYRTSACSRRRGRALPPRW